MKSKNVLKLSEDKFRRLTGLKKKTYAKMVEILTVAHLKKKAKGGRPNNLDVQDMLFMTLEYLREYRTYFHIANSYGVSESSAYKTIRWVEDTLIKSGEFSLPGKKALYGDSIEYDIILIDATETPIQRPQKNKENTTPVRRKNTPLKHKLSLIKIEN